MIRQRYFNGIILGLTFLFLCYGIRGYYPRNNGQLQEETPITSTVINEGDYPVPVILNKATGNPVDALKQPPGSIGRPLLNSLSDLNIWSGTREEVKETAFGAYAGTVYIDVAATDLIFPFDYFL